MRADNKLIAVGDHVGNAVARKPRSKPRHGRLPPPGGAPRERGAAREPPYFVDEVAGDELRAALVVSEREPAVVPLGTTVTDRHQRRDARGKAADPSGAA